MTRSSNRARRWDRLLELATVAVGASGPFFVVFGEATASLFKQLIFGTGANPIQGVEALDYTRFVYGVLGAVMVGWSVALWSVVTGPLRHREPWAWNAVGASAQFAPQV